METLEHAVDHLQRRIAVLEDSLRRHGLEVPNEVDSSAALNRISAGRPEQEVQELAELLNRLGPAFIAELDQQKIVQTVTDVATNLVGAEFGAFFHNMINERGESYMLYTLSGVPREAFARFPMPRNTAVFAPTFGGEAVVRSDDITQDSRYGQNSPNRGMPDGHLPVKSYLAVPVSSRSGEVLGGLFFGHPEPAKFTQRDETLVAGLAAHAAIAIDNARLFEQSQWVQDELKRANAELRRANSDLETFAYSASHDLQEPLRNVALNAQLLQLYAGNILDKEQTHFLDSILQGARHMETLVKDLLVYTQAIRHADGAPPCVSSDRVFTEVLKSVNNRIDESGATVTAENLPVVAMHEVHLSQLFQNMVSNALKYRRSEAPCVHFSAVQEDGWIVFSVADNGIGVEPQYADQIFVLFKRLHTREEFPGSGIGLAICQRIVEQYGGRIWLDKSVVGAGSTFSFSVPDRRP